MLLFSTNSKAQFDTEASLLKAFHLYVNNTKDSDTARVKKLSYFIDSAKKNNWQQTWVKIQIDKAQLLSGLYQLNKLVDVVTQTLPLTQKLNLLDENTVLQVLLLDAATFSEDIQPEISLEEVLSRLPKMKNDNYLQVTNLFLSSYYLQKEEFLKALPLLLNFNLQGDGDNWIANEAIKTSFLSEVYFQVGDIEKYEKYTNKSITLYEQMDDLTGKAIVLYNLIEGLLVQRKFDDITSLLPKWEKAVIAAGELTIEGDLYRIKGILALQEQHYLVAEGFLLKSKAIYQAHNLAYYAMLSDLALLEMLFKQGDMQQAKQKLLSIEADVQAYAKTMYLIAYYQLATNIYKNLQAYDLAFKYAENLKAEQLLLAEKKNGIEILKLEYQQGIIDKELEQAVLSEQQAQQRTIYNLIITIIVLVLFTVALVLYKQLSLKRKLAILANTDVLTSAPNRRAVLHQAQQQLSYCCQHNLPLTLAIADIDLFKAINDDFGHDVGDEVLKFFAKNASNTISSTEYHGRIGGEEWLFVLPLSEVELAQVLFDRLSQALAKKNDRFDLGDRKLTFSMGATERIEGDTLKTMISRADKQLYRAKENGRQCLCYG
ncbi:MAG: diguanylate cyclase domain-containing protein [Cognaticolwellia sp.]